MWADAVDVFVWLDFLQLAMALVGQYAWQTGAHNTYREFVDGPDIRGHCGPIDVVIVRLGALTIRIMLRAHDMMPTPKMAVRPSFWVRVGRREHMSGLGISKTVKSMPRLAPAVEVQTWRQYEKCSDSLHSL